MAPASGVIYLFRAVGSVLGISLSNTILQNGLSYFFRSARIPEEIAEGIRQNVSMIGKLHGKLYERVVHAYDNAMHVVFLWILLTAVAAMVCLYFIDEKPLPGHAPKPRRDNAEE